MPLPAAVSAYPPETMLALSPAQLTFAMRTITDDCLPWLEAHADDDYLDDVLAFRAWAQQITEKVRRSGGRRPRARLDARLDARDLAVRADRALGLVIRRLQALGKIRSHAHSAEPGAVQLKDLGIGTEHISRLIYAVTDDVSDEEFEAALAAARERHDTSRNCIGDQFRARNGTSIERRRDRVIAMAEQGMSSYEIARAVNTTPFSVRTSLARYGVEVAGDTSPAPAPKGRAVTVRRDAVESVDQQLYALTLLMDRATGLHKQIDASEAQRFHDSLTRGRRSLHSLIKHLKERSNAHA